MKPQFLIFLICSTLLIIAMLFGIYIKLTRLSLEERAALIAGKKCDEYVEKICNQAILKSRTSFRNVSSLTGGTDAREGMLPHMVFIAIFLNPKNLSSCGGTIISEYFVMTAAHCVHNLNKDQVFVILGSADIGNGVTFLIDRIHVHPNYKISDVRTYPNDIALLKLNKKVEFNWKIRPICLNTDFNSISITNMTVSGWGIDEAGIPSKVLRVVDTYIDGEVKKACISKYGQQPISVMICAGHPTEHKSTCEGDSGGPLQIPLKNACPNTYEQIGITSFSDQNCTESLGKPQQVMFTKVQLMLYWIVEVVWPDFLFLP